MRIALIIGTRPEIIKCAPIIQRLHSSDLLIHTNQHYSPAMDADFFREFDLRLPDYNLNVGSGSHAEQIAAILAGSNNVLAKQKPDWVLVQGDTNSSLGGALAASKAGLPVAHIEAGLRSGDRSMPEEINRIMIDHISEALFTPTEIQTRFLRNEGIPSEKIFEVGNTIADTIEIQLKGERIDGTEDSVEDDGFALLTLHRPENIHNKESLSFLIAQINDLAEELPVRFSVHPGTQKKFLQNRLELHPNIQWLIPQPYLRFLKMLRKATVVLTDSGGVQEEACILNTPCVTLRTTTERQETLKTGMNRLMSNNLKADVQKAMNKTSNGPSPYQPGATEKILSTIGHLQ